MESMAGTVKANLIFYMATGVKFLLLSSIGDHTRGTAVLGDMLLSHPLCCDPAFAGTTLCSNFILFVFCLPGQRKLPRALDIWGVNW